MSHCGKSAYRLTDVRYPTRGGAAAWFMVVLLLTVAWVTTGCRTAHFTAAKLPPYLDVPPAPSSNGIDLARMVGRGTGTSQIGPGDLVEVTIASGLDDDRVQPMPARVAHDGTVLVPLIGPVCVSELEPLQAEQRIAAAAVDRGVYRQPYVTLQVTERAVNRIAVLGAVEQPGVVELPRGSSDLVSAIAAAGGLSDSAGVQVDVLRHNSGAMQLASQPDSTAGDTTQGVRLASYANTMEPSATPIGFAPPPLAGPDGTSQAANNQSRPPAAPRTTRIDLSQINQSAGTNYELGDRDVVMILPEEKHVIHVTGLVQKPDQFELTPNRDVRVLDAIAMAGGIKTPLADKVFVIRQLPNMPEPAMIHVSIAKAKRNGRENLRLAPGDLVSVEATVATSIFDAASNFFRVAIGLSGSIVTF